MLRPWAFWRRVQYLTGFFVFFVLVFTVFFLVNREIPTCSDRIMNGDERGVDCGGGCTRVCVADVVPLEVLWSESFKIIDGQYNVVAYIENRNKSVGTPRQMYVFKLYDENGLIKEVPGEAPVPIDGTYSIFEGKIFTNKRIPTRTEIEFIGDTVWLPGTAGSEQITLKDFELTGVDTFEPTLLAEIQNNDLFAVEDLEIVATIFDSRKNPLTVSKTTVENIAGDTTKEIAFTWREPIATTLRSCEIPTDVMLAIDLSGSMNNDGDNPPEPISSVLNAAESFVKRLKLQDQVGLVTYATNALLNAELTGNSSEVGKKIMSLSIAPEEETGSTNTGDAIKQIQSEMSSDRHSSDARKVAILLTDGLATAPGENPDEYALSAASTLKDGNTILFTVGLGEQVNEPFLRSLATSPDHYYFAPSINQLQSIYTQITAAICEDGPTVVEIIPKVESNFPGFTGI